MVQKGSGKFEVTEGGTAIVSGTVRIPENLSYETASLESYEPHSSNNFLDLSSHDIYKELQLRGYNYQGLFRSLVSFDNFGECYSHKMHKMNTSWAAVSVCVHIYIFYCREKDTWKNCQKILIMGSYWSTINHTLHQHPVVVYQFCHELLIILKLWCGELFLIKWTNVSLK